MLVRKCGVTLRHMMMQLNGYKGNSMSLGGSSSSQQQLDPALRDLFMQNYQGAQGAASGLQARQFAGFNPDQMASANISRQFADPNSETFTGMRSAFDVAGRVANYAPQQVASRDVNAALAQAAQLGRETVRDVNAERIAAERIAAGQVSGADVASEALKQIAPEARANIRDVAAGSFLNQNIQQYMNPYTQAVTEQSLADLERSRQLQQQQTAAQATAARAFGGSRQGVAEAETNRAFGENAARLVAQQNAQAYEAAQRASEADLARQMQAQQLNQAQDLATTQQSLQLAGQFGLANQQAALEAARANQATGLTASQANQDAMLRAALANQGYDFSVGQLNTQNQQQVNLANQAAQNQIAQANAQNFLQANLANQGAGLQANQQRIGAAGQMANIAQAGQQMGFAGANQLAQQGAVQQQFSQAQLDAIRNLPLEQQQILNQALGINVGGGSGMQSSSSSGQGLFGLFR
jgi:hypothetical protein